MPVSRFAFSAAIVFGTVVIVPHSVAAQQVQPNQPAAATTSVGPIPPEVISRDAQGNRQQTQGANLNFQ